MQADGIFQVRVDSLGSGTTALYVYDTPWHPRNPFGFRYMLIFESIVIDKPLLVTTIYVTIEIETQILFGRSEEGSSFGRQCRGAYTT